MNTLIPSPNPNMTFLDHFQNPWKAVGWVVLIGLVITAFVVSGYWIFRLIKNRTPTVPPPQQGVTPDEAAQIREAYKSHPVRRIGSGLRKVGGWLGAVTRWALTRLQRCEFKSLKDYTDTVLVEISRLPPTTGPADRASTAAATATQPQPQQQHQVVAEELNE